MHRLQINLSERAVEELDRIQELTDAASRAEVIRNAVKIYAALLETGVTITKTRGDERVLIEFPGVARAG